MTERQAAILTGIYRDRESLAARTPSYNRDVQSLAERESIKAAKAGLVHGNPAKWLGLSMTASLYVMVSRAYKQLERRGLIERHALGYSPTMTTHLSLTPEGERVAREVATSLRTFLFFGSSAGTDEQRAGRGTRETTGGSDA